MSPRNLCITAAIVILFTWVYVPWQLAETNGTGDSILTYRSLGYAFVLNPPKPTPQRPGERTVKRLVQVDSMILALEDLVIALAALSGVVLSNRAKKSSEK